MMGITTDKNLLRDECLPVKIQLKRCETISELLAKLIIKLIDLDVHGEGNLARKVNFLRQVATQKSLN